jgi:hypothetical protein
MLYAAHNSDVHHTARFPGHPAFIHAPQSAVSGMSPVQSVSHIPGLHPRVTRRFRAGLVMAAPTELVPS